MNFTSRSKSLPGLSSPRATDPNTFTSRALCWRASALIASRCLLSTVEGRGLAAAARRASICADGLRVPFTYAAMFGCATPDSAASSCCVRPARRRILTTGDLGIGPTSLTSSDIDQVYGSRGGANTEFDKPSRPEYFLAAAAPKTKDV